MLFNTLPFAIFFIIFYCVFHFISRTPSQKLWLITLGSLFFYATWSPAFVPVLVLTGLVDFFVARAIGGSTDPRRKKMLVALSVGTNLGVLAFFKYTNFLLENLYAGLVLFGVHPITPPRFNIILPLGISFYTFQSISYVVDVYRGSCSPRKRFREFFASLTFFPHLLSGPIVRTSYILPQFEKISLPTTKQLSSGILLVSLGLMKKTIADLLAPIADQMFGATSGMSGVQTWIGVLAYAGQIYGDFAGYTDMAQGLAFLLGFELPINFNLPYLAFSPANYWSRWHISLSTWFRDYLYVPLGMKYRRSPYLALIVTWFLAGVWHGANWNCVIYGLYYGAVLSIGYWLASNFQPDWLERISERVLLPFQVGLTFYLVLIGFTIFRSQSVSTIARVLHDLHWPTIPSSFSNSALTTLALVSAAIVIPHAIDYLALKHRQWMEAPWVLWPTLATSLVISIVFTSSTAGFIYFAF